MRLFPLLAVSLIALVAGCESSDSAGGGRDVDGGARSGDASAGASARGGAGSGSGGASAPGGKGGANAAGRGSTSSGGAGNAAGGSDGNGGDGSGPGGSGGTGGTGNAGGSAGAGGAPVVNLPPGKGWAELPDTKIASVCACNDGFSQLCANSGCGGIFAWSSGAYDSRRSRLIVFGGGHSDYFGNELFALSLAAPAMTRITEPGLPPSTDCGPSIAGGTQPNSRHTYDALVYVEHADRLFVYGGSKSPCGYLGDDLWTYSFADAKWEAHTPSGPTPKGVPGIVADYDPETHDVLVHDDASLYRYDIGADAFEQVLTDVPIDYHLSGVIDVAHRKFVLVGSGSVFSYDLANGYARTELTTTGGDSIVDSGYPGLAYYPEDGGRVVAWNGGDTVYSLDLGTNTWTALTSSGGPGAATETGTYKRFRYVGGGAFVLVNRHDQNAYTFRL